MKDFSVLKLLDKLAHLFNKLHVDYPTMRRILQVKLLMDERRVPTILSNSQKPEGKNSFKSSLFLYGFIGLFIGLLMLLPLPLFVTMNIVFGTIMFMVMATMISDFSTVLLDVKDKNILLPRPVDSKSVNTAKIIHIVIYLITITLSISGPALLIGSIKHGIVFTLIFLIELILICFLVVFITSILYLAILSMFDGEKLKDIINYFQILLSAFMLISYQFIGRIFDLSRVTITYDPAWWHFFIPTTWFAAPFTLFIEHNFTGFFTWSSLLGIIIPGLTTLLYVFLVMPYFESKLQKRNSSSGHIRQTNIKEKLQQAAARLLCFSPTESAFYRFTQNMLANERKLKLRMYPHLAFAIIMPFIIMASSIKNVGSFSDIISHIASGNYFFGLYMTAAFLAITPTMLSASEEYRGAWIYRALPIESPAPVLKGALKALLSRIILPVYLFTALILILICGARIIPDIILIFINMLILIMLSFKMNNKELPFYRDFQTNQNYTVIGVMILLFIVCGACAGLHLFLQSITPGVAVNIVASLAILSGLWYKSFHITWKDIIKNSL